MGDQADLKSELCAPLPLEIMKYVNTTGEREKLLLDFLQSNLRPEDSHSLDEELKKVFVLDKVRSRAVKAKPSLKKQFLSNRQRKLMGIKTIGSQNQLKYNELLGLNKLWLEYILQVIGYSNFNRLPTRPTDSRWETINQKLIKADFHGAIITVIKSKCPSLIGLEGIIIQDTKNTFKILGKDNTVRTISKAVVVIKIHLIGASLELFGKEFCIRPAERSVKKIKANHMGEL